MGPYCGDGTVEEPQEECDDGIDNVVVYGGIVDPGRSPGCTPSCTLAPYCGDFVVDQEFGEWCDQGTIWPPYGTCAYCEPYAGP